MMLVKDLYLWLVDNGYNQMATNVNEAAGRMADAMSDEGGDLYIKEPGGRWDFEDTPEAAGG